MDSAGDQHLHIEHNIYKRRVDLSGNPIEEAKKENISTSTKKLENVSGCSFLLSSIDLQIVGGTVCVPINISMKFNLRTPQSHWTSQRAAIATGLNKITHIVAIHVRM